MPIASIRHINLFAPRALLLQLRDFYRDAIGLVEGERPPLRSSGFWLYAGSALGIEYRNQELPLTRQRQLFCKDPAGNGVELLFPA
jgi:hypothetical protein